MLEQCDEEVSDVGHGHLVCGFQQIVCRQEVMDIAVGRGKTYQIGLESHEGNVIRQTSAA